MATYVELFDLRSDGNLRNKVAVACVVKAQTLIALASPTAQQLGWAHKALQNPVGMAQTIMEYVLAANKSATVGQIQGATDATIQGNVDAAADKLLTLE